ncbi:glycoside hydrolase family 2 protein [Horticoccus luteus]|uniref:Beta-mannosidase B n=1 Tax=Horticoccus luteus TaxID=2862869 RepID=A0A8F9XLE1_9BACT|nr:glycoside hydrolase family 2 protein [Horticoccus luteus]QYM79121.1 glycoside hydrolase family 2 protein [Horticoccus luteus]
MTTLPLASAAWQFRDATQRSRWHSAAVPGCVHRDLQRAGLIPDPFFGTNELSLQWIEERDWEYRTTFTAPAPLLAETEIDLVCDGLDTLATVYLNGRRVATSDNMFVPLRVSVRAHLRRGRNELRIVFASAAAAVRATRPEHQPKEFNDAVGRGSVLRKQPSQFGWDWAPRLLTAGIWRDLRLEAWTTNRLESVRVAQHHAPTSDARPSAPRRRASAPAAATAVTLTLTPELARPDPKVTYHVTIALDGTTVAELRGPAETLTLALDAPQLWWPNGHGAQPLYTVHVAAFEADGRAFGQWSQRIGLRTLALDRSADQWGESFRFVVNGRPLFAKGANWVPAHILVAGLTRDDYARDTRAAAAANLNMLRVWGGGIYEDESFYDLCDELGLLVWQDFMFACVLYPGDAAFVASVRAEADAQIRRLRHRACLALWCGNNEIETLNWDALQASPDLRRNYHALFHDALPAAVAAHDGVTPYWPTSPYRGDGRSNDYTDTKLGEISGDTHFWAVWHAGRSVKEYEKWQFRFVSEFGMQAFASPEAQATFCPPGQNNVFGPVMENHQKHPAGNQIVLDYVSRLYRYPKNQDALCYLSELNEAFSMQVAVEHYRRQMPRCMGALYWQLNDCWPVTSASSIEFNGRWRALHYATRRYFAPALVSAHVPGEESTVIGNYRRSSVREVHLYTVYDAPAAARGTLRWDLFHVDGRILLAGKKRVALRYGESIRQHTLDLAALLARYGRDNVYLRIALDLDAVCVSEETIFLTVPRFVALPRARPRVSLRLVSPTEALLTVRSPVFQHRFAFEFPGLPHFASDNFFDLYPDEPKQVRVHFHRRVTRPALLRALQTRTLADSAA